MKNEQVRHGTPTSQPAKHFNFDARVAENEVALTEKSYQNEMDHQREAEVLMGEFEIRAPVISPVEYVTDEEPCESLYSNMAAAHQDVDITHAQAVSEMGDLPYREEETPASIPNILQQGLVMLDGRIGLLSFKPTKNPDFGFEFRVGLHINSKLMMRLYSLSDHLGINGEGPQVSSIQKTSQLTQKTCQPFDDKQL